MEILVMKILLALSLALIVFLLSFRKLEDGRIYVVRRAGADYRYILVYKDHALRYDNDQRGPKVAYSKGSSGTGFNILNYYLIGIPFIFSIKEIPYKKVNVTGAGPEATFEAAPGSSTTYAKAQQDTYGVVLQNRYDKNGVVVELFQYAIKAWWSIHSSG